MSFTETQKLLSLALCTGRTLLFISPVSWSSVFCFLFSPLWISIILSFCGLTSLCRGGGGCRRAGKEKIESKADPEVHHPSLVTLEEGTLLLPASMNKECQKSPGLA